MKSPTFRGQANQDGILWTALFQYNTQPGYFVDVGAHDGMSFSNTLALEEIGWTGLCIEAHPDYIMALGRNRPFSEVVHAAAGPQNLPAVTFYGTPFGFLSTVDAADVAQLDVQHGYGGQGRMEYTVPMRRLDDMLHESHAPIGFEFLCIDTEGYEVEILKGMTLPYWKPRVLLLEAFDAKHAEALVEYMSHTGYTYARKIGVDLVYCRDAADAERVRTWQGQISIPA